MTPLMTPNLGSAAFGLRPKPGDDVLNPRKLKFPS